MHGLSCVAIFWVNDLLHDSLLSNIVFPWPAPGPFLGALYASESTRDQHIRCMVDNRESCYSRAVVVLDLAISPESAYLPT